MMTRGVASSSIGTNKAGSIAGAIGARRASSLPSVDISGMHAIVATATTSGKRTTSAPIRPPARARPRMTKPNSPPGPSSKPACNPVTQRSPNARAAGDDDELHHHQHDPAQHDPRRVGRDIGEIEAHADRDQEHAEQQALE